MNKFFRGLFLMGAAALVTVGSSLVEVKAAPMAPTVIKVNYDEQKLTIAKGSNKKIYVATSTVTTKKVVNKADKTTKEVTTVKTAVPVEYDAEANTIVELSSLAVTKDNYISIWGDKNPEPVLVKLPAIKTKLKAVVNAAENKITIQDTTDAKNPVTASDTLQYCTVNGSWKDFVNGTQNLDSYAKMGATLRIRIKATTPEKALAAADEKTIGTDADGAAVKAYVASGNFAGNELKAKIAKTAAGPKATIDYNLRTIKIPATAEYRLTGASANALGTYTSVEGDTLANGKKATTATLQVDSLLATAKAGDFDIRTKKTDKKPASQITEYHLYAVTPIATVTKVGTAYKAPTTSTDVSEAAVGSVNQAGYSSPDVQCTKVTLSSAGKGTVTLQNNTENKYQIVVVANSATPQVPAANAKVKATLNLTKAGAAKPSVVNVAVASGDLLYIRKMGDAKLTTWSSPYVLLGIVNNTFPATK